MSVEVKVQTGFAGEAPDRIVVESYDHNNVHYTDEIMIAMEPQDKPRTLTVFINGKIVYQRQSNKQQYV